MRRLRKLQHKKGIRIIYSVLFLTLFLAIINLKPIIAFAYWDSTGGGRPTLTLTGGDENGDHQTFLDEDGNPRSFIGDYTPIFNSIVNNSSYGGDERNFVSAIASENAIGKDAIWASNIITAEDGKIYMIRMYIHNNNPNGKNATATGTSVAFNIPQESAGELTVGGYIYADNANVDWVYDDVIFQSPNQQPFHLEYVYGSAIIRNNGFANVDGGVSFPDDAIVTNATNGGAPIGYEGFDGKIPGCFEYTQLVCIKVKVVYEHEFELDVKVRLAGTQDEFVESIAAGIGDRVEYQIQFTNSAANDIHENVIIRDVLPDNMVYVDNTTYLYNSNHKDGEQVIPDGDLFDGGINIGSYKPNASGWVRFTAEVTDKSLEEGDNILVNWAQGMVKAVIHQDHAKTMVQKPQIAHTIITVLLCVLLVMCPLAIICLLLKLRRTPK